MTHNETKLRLTPEGPDQLVLATLRVTLAHEAQREAEAVHDLIGEAGERALTASHHIGGSLVAKHEHAQHGQRDRIELAEAAAKLDLIATLLAALQNEATDVIVKLERRANEWNEGLDDQVRLALKNAQRVALQPVHTTGK